MRGQAARRRTSPSDMEIPGHEVTVQPIAVQRDSESYPRRAYEFICECNELHIVDESLQEAMTKTLHHLVEAAGMILLRPQDDDER